MYLKYLLVMSRHLLQVQMILNCVIFHFVQLCNNFTNNATDEQWQIRALS